jgi:hypothetical protein
MLSDESSSLRSARKVKRNALFLKGPLTFEWIISNIPDPSSRLILLIRAFMDMQGKAEIPLTQKIWSCAGITDKDARRRAIKKLREHSMDYEIITRIGRQYLIKPRL